MKKFTSMVLADADFTKPLFITLTYNYALNCAFAFGMIMTK